MDAFLSLPATLYCQASQVLEAFIAQSLIAHSATNCTKEVLFDCGRKRAKELDIEFKKNKLPEGIKLTRAHQDDIEGYDTTIGLTSCVNKPAHSNADFVKSMLDAGAVPFVKINVLQTMYSYECNPIWAYSSGGSSGGEACMLSLDASVIGLGSYIALRIPVAYCGIYSLKPGLFTGAHRVFPGFDGIKSVCSPMAGCMDDLELNCRVSFGAPGAYNNLPPLPFRDVTLPKKLQFGYYTSSVDGVMKASPACIRAVKETINALELVGHDCVELDQWIGSDPLDSSLSVLTFGSKLPQLVRTIVAWAMGRFVGDKVMSDILRLSGPCTVEEYHASCLRRSELKKEFYREFWQKHNLDGIITHVHASPQILHSGSNMLSMMSASTLAYNLLDSPSGVFPVTHVKAAIDELTDEWINGLGHGSSMCESELYFKGKKPLYDPTAMDGMPIRVQIIGRTWEDEKILVMMRVVDDGLGKERGFPPVKRKWQNRNVTLTNITLACKY
ncbi:amidase signature domain-containing protein [Mycena epipterygia]|nr:amidase signature domain-containing protein [Mycena epipterygia]